VFWRGELEGRLGGVFGGAFWGAFFGVDSQIKSAGILKLKYLMMGMRAWTCTEHAQEHA
jgi:hypothetical protein